MTILVVNPNSTRSMTTQLAAHCAKLGKNLEFTTCDQSPVSIEGFSDGARASFHLLNTIMHYEQLPNAAIEAYVIACFDDTGLDAVRELTDKPVIGIGEAAAHIACFISTRFFILTTLQRSVTIIERNLKNYGLYSRCAGVFASNIAVLDLEQDASSYQRFCNQAQDLIERQHADCLVLGCAGMSPWVTRLEKDLGIPVLDGVSIAIKLATSLVELNIKTSKSGAYRFPEAK